jgi:transcriptional regulator with XRE-family HTH domain
VAEDRDRRSELGDFLRSRRNRLAPELVGLPRRSRRRTPGLRREDVAELSDVGISWYTQLEQGRDIHASAQILKRIAGALLLNEDERSHLFFLAGQEPPASQAPVNETVSPALQWVFDQLHDCPAMIRGRRWDLLAWNSAMSALFGDAMQRPPAERNALWLQFMDLNARRAIVNWEEHLHASLALFRVDYDRFTGDRAWFAALIDDLNANSPEFRAWWPRHEVNQWRLPADAYRHPAVGELVLRRIALQSDDCVGVRLVVFTPHAGTDTAEKLRRVIADSGAPAGATRA